MNTTLPTSWRSVKLGEVAQVNPTKPSTLKEVDPNLEVSFVPMKAVDDVSGKVTDPEVRKLSKVSKGYTYFENDWVLFAKITPCMENGKSAIARDLMNGIGFGSTEFHTVVPSDEIIPEYIYHYLRQEKYRYDAKLHFRGAVGQQRVPPEFLRDTMIPLPKVDEQQKIVDKIEELFSVVDAIQGSVAKAVSSTDNFETSLIRAAFSGELSSQLKNSGNEDIKNFIKSNSIKPLDYNNNFFTYDIPKNWIWVRLSDIADVKGGIAKNSNMKLEESVQLPYLRVANVQRGYFNLDEIKDIKVPRNRLEDLLLREGDILLTEGGDRDKLGRGWVWEAQIDPCTHQNHIFRARLNDPRINPWLISTFINELGKWYFMKEGKQTTNLASISLTKLRNLPVPLIPFDEAEFIYRELKAHRSELKNMTEQTRLDLLRINKLKQSILKQAFEGKLV